MVYLFLPKQENNASLVPTLSSGECLGLEYLASMLRLNGYTVKIVNAECELEKNIDLIDLLKKDKPFLLGISPVAVTMMDTLSISKMVKELLPNTHITLGGHHVSAVAKELLYNEECIDSVIMGEGEYSIVELANMLSKKTHAILENISIRVNGNVKLGKNCIIDSIDEMPYPTRDTLEKLICINNKKEARLVTSRGCIGNCTFCTSPHFYNRTWRAHSSTRVVNEIEALIKNYGISHIWINDDAYIVKTKESQQRAYDIAAEIIDRNLIITYRALLRADSLDGAIDFLPMLKNSGLNTVFIGLDTASDHVLNIYNKGIKQIKNLEIINILREHGIKIQIGFIMFNPYSSIEDLKKNAYFLKEIGELFRMFPLTRTMDLFPGTSMLNMLANDLLLSKHYSYKCNNDFDYLFCNKKVEQAFKIVNRNYDALSQRYDAELNNIFFHDEYKYFEMLKNELNEIHYNYFLDILNSNCSEESICRINDDRLYRVGVILSKMKGGALC